MRFTHQETSDKVLDTYINAQTDNNDGLTALHLAAYHGNFVSIKNLLNNGANPYIRSK